MAVYKSGEWLQQSDDPAFDHSHNPGSPAGLAGIYRCTSCGGEVACNAGVPLPPQNHTEHSPMHGLVRWQLIVYAVQQ